MSSTSKKKASRTAVAASKRVPSPARAPAKRRTGTARQSGTAQARPPAADPTEERSPSPGESLAGAFENSESNLARQPDEGADRPANAALAAVAECPPKVGGASETAPSRPERPASKRALVISMLQRPDGASLFQLTAATGWLPHTARAALTGLRHKGFVLEKSKNAQAVTVYRIAEGALDGPHSKSTKLEELSSSGRGASELSSALRSADAPVSCSSLEPPTSALPGTLAASEACASNSEKAA